MTRPTAMPKDSKPALTPKLRFPEFRNEPGWNTKRLDEVCAAITQGGTPDTSVAEYWNGDVCWLTPAEMGKSETPFVETTERKVTEEGLRNCSSILLPINSVILSTRAPIGYLAINRTPMAINQGCKGLIPSSELDFRFLYFSLSSNKRRLNDLGSGNTFKELSGSALKAFNAAFPRLAEQQKIAECLSTLDELIGAESQKLDALKAHKKGLMQQLFPREGETLPRLRFPEFRSAPEWTSDKLSAYLHRVIDYRGKAPPKSDSGIPLITAKNVRLGWLDMSNDEYIEADEYNAWMTKGIPAPGDILFTTEAPLGNVARFPAGGKFALGQRIITLQTSPKKCLSDFLFQALLSPSMQKSIDFHSTGSAAKGIKSSVFVTLKLSAPGIEEQHRIATCLNSLDELIAAQSDRLSALQTHKQGLLQQLFPASEISPLS